MLAVISGWMSLYCNYTDQMGLIFLCILPEGRGGLECPLGLFLVA